MVQEAEIAGSLSALVEDLIRRSPFFRSWEPGRVGSAASGKFLASFDSLVGSFPALIAAGAGRMEDEASRTVLAVNLYQECGEGDLTRTHHAIYRKFLATAGIPAAEGPDIGFAVEWRSRLSGYIARSESAGAVLGVLASGEFLAQPALSRIYSVLKPQYPQADHEYFTKHLVLETDHVREITSIIARHSETGAQWGEVLSGFKFGLSAWETYFNRLNGFLGLTGA